MEVGGSSGSSHDVLAVGGTLAAGGTLEVVLASGYDPAAGDEFDLLDFGSVVGEFALNLPGLGSNLDWDAGALYSTGSLSVTAVPEPGALVLLVGCLVVVGGKWKRL